MCSIKENKCLKLLSEKKQLINDLFIKFIYVDKSTLNCFAVYIVVMKYKSV